MHLKREILLVLGTAGVIIAAIMFVYYHSLPERTDGMLFGLTQLLVGISIGVAIGTYLGLKSEQARLEQIISQE